MPHQLIAHFIIFSLPLSILCADTQKKTLVAFSTRMKDPTKNSFYQAYWGEDRCDLSYNNRPDIITLDIKPAVHTGPHIIADATKPIQADIPNLTKIYLERPFTCEKKDNDVINTLAHYLPNLLPLLPDHHTLVLEWDPSCSFFWPDSPADQHTINKIVDEMTQHNPFTGHFNGKTCLLSTECALNLSNVPCHESPTSKKIIDTYKENIKYLLEKFSHNTNVSLTLLQARLALETRLIKLKKENDPCDLYTGKDVSLSLETIHNSVDSVIIAKPTLNKAIDLKTNKLKLLKNGFKQDKYTKFSIGSTLFTVIWSRIAVGTNVDACIACLEQHLGLYNVQLTEGISDVSGRKNVFLLTGLKSPISTAVDTPPTISTITDALIKAATIIPNANFQERALNLAQRLHTADTEQTDDDNSLETQD